MRDKDEMDNKNDRIGLIAGGGQFPIIFSKRAKRKGKSVYAIAYIKEARRELEEHVESIE